MGDDLTLEGVNARIVTHEAVCAERYNNLMERTKRIEMIMWAVAGAIATAFLYVVLNKP